MQEQGQEQVIVKKLILTPFGVACYLGHSEIVKILIEARASVFKNWDGVNTLHLGVVAEKNNLRILTLILSSLSKEEIQQLSDMCSTVDEFGVKIGETPMMTATRLEKQSVIDLIKSYLN